MSGFWMVQMWFLTHECPMRTLGLSGLEKRKTRGDLVALRSSLRRRSAEGGAGLCSLVTHVRTGGNGTELCQGSSDWALGRNSVPWGWANTGTSFLVRWLEPPCLLVFKNKISLIISINFWLALKWPWKVPSEWTLHHSWWWSLPSLYTTLQFSY